MSGISEAVKEIKQGFFYEIKHCHPLLIQQLDYIEKNIKTPSGLSLIDHASAIIKILMFLEVGQDSINAVLLYCMVEYGDLPCDDLDMMPPAVLDLVNGVQKMTALSQVYSVSGMNDSVVATDSMRKMMLAMVHDGRTVLIKIVEQIVILLHSKNMSTALREKYASDTMMIYAPLANRLGLSALKWQLEDLAFKINNPKIYKSLSDGLSVNRIQRESVVVKIVSELKQLLAENDIVFVSCYGRVKHLFSLYNKMQRKNLTLQEIYDAIAIRIILNDIESCYKALSFIHGSWEVILKEFDDYIAKPKKNGYQSIHTAVMYQDFPVEIQIRTQEMHDFAELGFAAHWFYKESDTNDIRNKSKWLLQLTKLSPMLVDAVEPNTFEQNAVRLFQDRVFVFTPKGEVKDLINGATALDFAYSIHSQVGHKCKGVKINGVIASIKTVLKNGDRVEVLTNKAQSPSKDWLKSDLGYLKTAKARSKVASWFRLQDDNTRELGRNNLQKFCRVNGIDAKKAMNSYCEKNKINHDYFYYSLGSSQLKLNNIFRDYLVDKVVKDIAPFKAPIRKSSNGIIVSDIADVPTVLAGCCYPVPGDPIVGIVTKKRGIVVHRSICSNVSKPDMLSFVDVAWSSSDDVFYEVRLSCSCHDYFAASDALQKILIAEKVRLTKLNMLSGSNDYGQTVIEFSIVVNGSGHLEKLTNKLVSDKHISNVWRQV